MYHAGGSINDSSVGHFVTKCDFLMSYASSSSAQAGSHTCPVADQELVSEADYCENCSDCRTLIQVGVRMEWSRY